MKRFGFVLLVCLSVALVPTVSQAADPQAGSDYIVLPTPQPVETGDKIEVREFFWYGCPHCYALEPALAAYVKKLSSQVRFVRTPGVAPNWLIHAQAYYTFESLGVTDRLHGPFFAAVHTPPAARPTPAEETGFFAFFRNLFGSKPQPVATPSLNSEAGITAFAAEHGVDRAAFSEAFNSFGVRTRLEHAKQQNIGFRIDGVPMLAIDGRYITSPSMAKGEEAMLKVVDFLIQKAAKERKK